MEKDVEGSREKKRDFFPSPPLFCAWSGDCSFIFLLSDSASASVVDQDECQKALDNLLNSFQDVMDLQAKVGLIFLVILCNCQK